MPLNRTNFCWSFRYLQTSTMRAGSIHSVGSLCSAWPPVIASGTAPSSAPATAWSRSTSGSILFHLASRHVVGAGLICSFTRPIQRALLQDVKISRQDQNHEQKHLEKPEQLQLAVHHGPWIEKHRFDVEKDEDDSDQ